ncbi:MAG TPA: TIGR03084 family metal-binding protein [Ramlibacter sp.]|nr:TIGR03084 family metal-binding protein [Ramlibacter sp.]
MKNMACDLLAEYEALAVTARGLTAAQWAVPTGFFHWTPWDEIAHLCYFDAAALLAVQGQAAFGNHLATLMPRLARGEQISDIAREAYDSVPGPELLTRWRSVFVRLVDALAALGPTERLPWYGPPMSARSFASARLMEVWAHGQDIHDAVRASRPATRRLRHIAHIGVTTYGWSFVNRKLPVPSPGPHVCLMGPDADEWAWGDPSSQNSVKGPAHDFCLVVTQRRNLADTSLQIRGAGAQAWMDIAQCFAGPPADGPTPGARNGPA